MRKRASIERSALEALIDQLIDSSQTTSRAEIARRKTFVATRLAAAGLALASSLTFMATSPASLQTKCALFLLAQAPLAAVACLARGGGLTKARDLSLLGWLSLSAALFCGLNAPVGALALIGVALLEAFESQSSRRIFAVLGASFAVLAASRAASGDTSASAAIFGLAILAYPALLAALGGAARAEETLSDLSVSRDFAALTTALDDLVIRYDGSGAVLSILGDRHMSYGIEARDLLGRGFFQRVHVADRPAFLKLINDALQASSPLEARLRVQMSPAHPTGGFAEPYFVDFDVRAMRAADETAELAATVLCLLRDLTTADQEPAPELATTGAGARFLANISHELRTPLNAIIGFSEMLGNEQLEPREPERRREYAQIIRDSGHHLLEVVNSILDMSKIESGSMQILPEPFALAPLVDQCCDMMHLKATQNGIELRRDYAGDLGEIVADRRACKQTLINLLSNAVKFTPAGGNVAVRVRAEGNFIALSVIDTGIGISSSDLAKVGNPFFQASAAHDRHYEGTGLGLSVVRGLVGLHGGSIAILSAQKAGTTVTVRLPLDCRAHAATPLAKIDVVSRHGAVPIDYPARESIDAEKTVKKIA